MSFEHLNKDDPFRPDPIPLPELARRLVAMNYGAHRILEALVGALREKTPKNPHGDSPLAAALERLLEAETPATGSGFRVCVGQRYRNPYDGEGGPTIHIVHVAGDTAVCCFHAHDNPDNRLQAFPKACLVISRDWKLISPTGEG